MCLQYENVPANASVNQATHYKGMIDAFIKTYKYEGIKGLYKVSLRIIVTLSG